jgi:NAD(P)-dependent dehydrogenase (short-subunit alcohol dehydrogenase family)
MAKAAEVMRPHVYVTGAGSGIGRAIALRLARDGYQLTLAARTKARLDATAREIAKQGGAPPLVQVLDIRNPAAVERAFAAAAKQHGPLHALVANAGIGGPNAAGKQDRFADLVATNLSGTYHCLRAAEQRLAPGPAERHLIVQSSILARIGVAGYSGYCASKAGLLGLVRALAMELAPRNVRVNALCPGWVETDMALEGLAGMAKALRTDLDGARKLALQAVPLGRMSQPEDVAGLVAWLLSKDARGVTGQALDMNNGAFMS